MTEHFSLTELIRSTYATRHGIDNRPPIELLENGRVLAEGLERVRDILSVPLYVESAYRNAAVNVGVGGAVSPPSQHMKFQAADFVPLGMPLQEAMKRIVANRDVIQYDQLIYEGNWLHISFVAGKPRGDTLLAVFKAGEKTRYQQWA